jgi:selenide,water dikinase
MNPVAGARLVLGRAIGMDRAAKRVRIEGQADIAYDIAAIDVGITTELPMIPGFGEHALGAKPLDRYAAQWEAFLNGATSGTRQADIVVIGGGVAGVELALAMMHHMKTRQVPQPKVTVVEQAAVALGGIGSGARQALLRHMERLDVALMTGVQVTEITADTVRLSNGATLAHGFCIASATARPHDWLRDTGLTNDRGFIDVRATLQTRLDPGIYATGDCADLTHAPRPKAGVFAVREAPILYHNLRAELLGTRRKAFRPQKSYLKLISTGGKGAIADKAGLRLGGAWLWQWKDHIDRKFMRRFENYPRMPPPALPRNAALGLQAEIGEAPLCGGCGAKVAPGTLGDLLATLPATARKDVLSAPGDDAAILSCGPHQQVLTTDHLRGFVNDPYRMAKIAAIHALGDIWAMGAKPQAALTSIVLPPLGAKLQAETLREIMAAAQAVFSAAGAEIVGGHTSQGAELTLGFTLTGLTGDRVIRNTGAEVGDRLILTKPLGSGTVLAGEMRMLAQGGWVQSTYEMMERPLSVPSGILAPHAHAMTDITGFGLAGHLHAMVQKTGQGADIDLGAVPFLDGALRLAEQGVRSSIWNANRAAVPMETTCATAAETLLFDPQTAGGLLAAVPPAQAGACLARLQEQGETAAIIGEITAGGGLRLR